VVDPPEAGASTQGDAGVEVGVADEVGVGSEDGGASAGGSGVLPSTGFASAGVDWMAGDCAFGPLELLNSLCEHEIRSKLRRSMTSLLIVSMM